MQVMNIKSVVKKGSGGNSWKNKTVDRTLISKWTEAIVKIKPKDSWINVIW